MPVIQPPRRNLHPRNQRAVEIAQNTIQRVAPLAQEQYNNALRVNGYDAIIYNRLHSGRKCSCSLLEKFSPTVLDTDGNATQEHIHTLLTGSKFGIRDYNTKTSNNPNVFSFDETSADLSTPQDETLETISVDPDPRTTTVEGGPDDFQLEQDLGNDMAGKCNICYGNSFVGGYSVFNGIRIVLDTTFFSLPDTSIPHAALNETALIQTEMPNKFEVLDSGYVIFQTVLPKNLVSLDGLRIWDNFTQITGRLEIKYPADVNFVTLNANNVLNFATGTTVQIKVSKVRYFTHVELQFNASRVVTHIEYPRLTKTGDLSVLEAIDGVSLVVGPLVTNIQPWDVIVDNVFRKIWRVTSSNWFNDRNMNIHGWDIQARLVQEYELQHNMLSRRSQQKITTNFNR